MQCTLNTFTSTAEQTACWTGSPGVFKGYEMFEFASCVSLDILAMVRGSWCMTCSPSSFLCCTMVARTLMTRCLSEVLTKGDPRIT